MPLTLDALLLYLACVQGMGLFAVSCTADARDLERLKPYFFKVCETALFTCFVNPQRKMIMLYENGMIQLSGKTDRAVQQLEDDSGVAFSFS